MIITVHASAGAKKNELIKITDLEYKIKVTAPKDRGRANAMIIKLLSEHLNIPKTSLTIKSGTTARTKLIDVN